MEELIKSLIAALQDNGVKRLSIGGVDQPLVAVPEEYAVQSLEQFAIAPSEIREVASLHGVPSFIEYVRRHKNEDSAVFVTPNLTQLRKGAVLSEAIIDYHGRGSNPRWGKHRALLVARPGLGYEKLMELDGKLLDQAEFGKAMEDLVRYAVGIDSADLLETMRTLVLTSKGEFKNAEDELSGSIDFTYNMAVNASAGTANRKLSVPAELTFNTALVDGMPDTPVRVKFLYRVPMDQGGKVQCGIKIIDRVYLEDMALQEVAQYIRDETDLQVFVGTRQ